MKDASSIRDCFPVCTAHQTKIWVDVDPSTVVYSCMLGKQKMIVNSPQ